MSVDLGVCRVDDLLLEQSERSGESKFFANDRDGRIGRVTFRSPGGVEVIPSQVEGCVDERSGGILVDPDFDRDVAVHATSDDRPVTIISEIYRSG